jgi:hypothetical protein
VQPVGLGRRALVRGALATVSSGWKSTTDTYRQQWRSGANSQVRTDSLGQTFKLTGHQLFVALNTQRLNTGQSQLVACPAPVTLGLLTFGTVSIVAGTFTFSVGYTSTLGASDFILISASRPCSAGQATPPPFCQIKEIAGNATSPVLLATPYSNRFGYWWGGCRIFVKLTPVGAVGWKGVPVIASFISG